MSLQISDLSLGLARSGGQPGGGTPADYVEELGGRFDLLHLHP